MSDILDLQAVVKHSTPVCTDARDLLESGKLRLAQVKTLARMTYFVSFAWPCCVLCASELSRSISARLWCLVVSWRLTMRTVQHFICQWRLKKVSRMGLRFGWLLIGALILSGLTLSRGGYQILCRECELGIFYIFFLNLGLEHQRACLREAGWAAHGGEAPGTSAADSVVPPTPSYSPSFLAQCKFLSYFVVSLVESLLEHVE